MEDDKVNMTEFLENLRELEELKYYDIARKYVMLTDLKMKKEILELRTR